MGEGVDDDAKGCIWYRCVYCLGSSQASQLLEKRSEGFGWQANSERAKAIQIQLESSERDRAGDEPF